MSEAYLSFCRAYRRGVQVTGKAWLWFDRLWNVAFPNAYNPNYYLGGIANLFLWVCMLSGVVLFAYYVPNLQNAWATVNYLTGPEVPYGNVVRAIHRYGADGMMIGAFLHGLRVWWTDRFRKFRALQWLSGVILISFTLFIGITGYLLVWDSRSYLLAQEIVRMLMTLNFIPGLGSALANFFQGGSLITDFTLTRFFFFHIGLPFAMFFFLWIHYIRVNRPVIYPPMVVNLFLIGFVLLCAGLFPFKSGAPAVVGRLTTTYDVDWLYMWPFVLMNYIGPAGVMGVLIAIFLILYTQPWWWKEPYRNVPVVIDEKCTGCRLCEIDCHANAIYMTSTSGKKKSRPFLARIHDARCAECGICVGACPFQALELPLLRDRTIEERIVELCQR
ncbi:MAG: cytochrome b N-terminal domain-containing protein [Chloroflexi bacterium]|nr:cytochrome b N-terminal domain-containing protein [Chloroflexota bacterium]